MPDKALETQYKIAGPLVERAVGVATSRVPGAGDLANAFIGNLMEDLEKGAKADNHGGVAFDVGNALGDGCSTSVAIAEAALYESGRIPVPDQLIVDG